MAKKFKFQLQPALDKAIGDREKAERALLEAKRALEAEEAELKKRQDIVRQTTQRITTEHDNLVATESANPQQLLERQELLDALRARRQQQIEAVTQQKSAVAIARQKLKLRRDELNAAVMQVRAMERMKDKALAEHKKVLDRALQNEIDEAGIQRAIRQQRGGP